MHLAEDELAGEGTSEELGSDRSSGIAGLMETEGVTHGTELLQYLLDALKPLVASDGRAVNRRATGDELPWRISPGSGENRARGRDRRGKLGGNLARLTGSAVVALACSGTACRERTPAASFGDPRKKTTASH